MCDDHIFSHTDRREQAGVLRGLCLQSYCNARTVLYDCALSSQGLGIHSLTRQLEFSTVQYNAVQYSTVQCSTVQYSTVQYSTVHQITL
jgi:hypothetical protein